MLKRWAAVAMGVGLLATMAPTWPLESHAADGAACDPNAKTANLNLTLKEMSGKAVTLSAYKGKVLLVDFWATWCGPCKIEIPGFVELYSKYRSQGFEIVGVLLDDQIAKAKPFARQFKMNYPVLDGEGHDDVKAAMGGVWGLPTSVIIGRDGKICKKHTGFAPKEQFEKEIKALL